VAKGPSFPNEESRRDTVGLQKKVFIGTRIAYNSEKTTRVRGGPLGALRNKKSQ